MLTGKLENMVQVAGREQIGSKIKAVVALFPYAAWRERGGDNRMADTCIAVIKTLGGSYTMGRWIAMLLDEADLEFPSRVMIPVSQYANWHPGVSTNTVTRWAAAALAVPYTEEVGQSVVDALLQIAYHDHLLLHIPVDIWAWLKKRPSLPPICEGRHFGTKGLIVHRVRVLGVELLESYFLLVWSEWDSIYWSNSLSEMHTSIREDFGGIGMWRHREVLTERLDHVLGQLDLGLEHLHQQKPYLSERSISESREQYRGLKKLLLEVDKESLAILTRMSFIYSFDLLTKQLSTESHSIFACALPLPCP